MAYIINHTDGSKYVELGEAVLDQTLGISLIGQNFHNYGQLIATNFLHLLENQANSTPPLNPIEGQLWWNTSVKQLNYFNGNQWKTCNNTAINDNPPIHPTAGDQWWDSSTNQLKAYNGTSWLVIGPTSSTYGGLTVSGNILPSLTNVFDIGSTTSRFNNIYGTAVLSNNADVAENYHSDIAYDYGTVVVFGGENEITVSNEICDHRIAGIISENPAYLMNNTASSDHQAVALTGKVPCLVIGTVKKGDLLVNSELAGIAMALTDAKRWKPGCVIGKSLEASSDPDVRLVMVAVGRF